MHVIIRNATFTNLYSLLININVLYKIFIISLLR